VFAVAGYAITALLRKARATSPAVTAGAQVQNRQMRDTWRMPPLDELPAPQLTLSERIWARLHLRVNDGTSNRPPFSRCTPRRL
jgi:hypothetical protein